MKKLLIILVGAMTLGALLPALAAPDWQPMEQGRKNTLAQAVPTEKPTAAEKCLAKRLVLPLDHGPRAQSTPYLNRKRSEAFEAEMKACKEGATKGIT